MGNSPRTASIHVLDDDSLLNIFYLYRPAIFDGDDNDNARISGGKGWVRERWWYNLAQVCQRWRNLTLGSASHLRLSLVCTWGTPVTDMLAQSPPLPLVIDYFNIDWDITADEEEEIILALNQHDRVRRVRLQMPAPKLQKFIAAMEEEYPVLEYLILAPLAEDESSALMIPQTLHAPHLRHLLLRGFVLPIGSRLLRTAVGLVTLALILHHPSTYFQPDTLIQWISFMPQLEMLKIIFSFPVPSRDVERRLMPIMTHVTLPDLRCFFFLGVSAYLEAVVRRIVAPRLERLQIDFFKQLTFSMPRLLQFMNATENLRFDSVDIEFYINQAFVTMRRNSEVAVSAFSIYVFCWHLDWQVSSVAQIFNSLSQMFSTVERLTLAHWVHDQSSEEHNEVDRTEWRKLLSSFSNVKTLHIGEGLVKELSRSLRPDDGELPPELLPELQEITYYRNGETGDMFTLFIDARQNAGRPVLVHNPRGFANTLTFSETGSREARNDLDT
jgi:hypothetical protein